MNNDSWKKFLETVKKIDNIDIELKYKPERIYKRGTFFITKKFYTLNLYAVCNLNKQFPYILAD